MRFEVLSEAATLARCRDFSIARFGDGELRLAAGGGCSSQRADPKLAEELRGILKKRDSILLVGVPNFERTPNKMTWDKYRAPQFSGLMTQAEYGSAFITRPDNAPWIDTPAYWAQVRSLWSDRDVLLVTGDQKSLTAELMPEAASVTTLKGPRQHAYAVIDDLEKQVTASGIGTVLLCLGACATVLAARLTRRGCHALDLGHIGMFMRHAGSYVDPRTLISKHYVQQNRELHARPEGFGGSGKKHVERVLAYADKIGASSVLDYGCGESTLAAALRAAGWKGFISEYDPGMPTKQQLPKPAQLLVSTDVLEHVEPELLDNVLRHMHAVTELGAFVTIATRPANKILPDGRNAHLIQETPAWWIAKLEAIGWNLAGWEELKKEGKSREIWVWLLKEQARKV